MNIQRFVAADSRLAMRQVREALGEDALILSNRQVADGVEIIAADGSDEMLFGESNQALSEQSAGQRNTAATRRQPSLASPSHPPEMPEDKATPSTPASVSPEKTEFPDVYNAAYQGIGSPETNSAKTPPVLQPIISGDQHAQAGKNQVLEDAIEKAKASPQFQSSNVGNASKAENQQINIMREELARLRGMMENQFSSMHMGLWAQNSPARATVLKRMTELGLTDSLAAKIVSSLKNIDTVTPQVSARDALAALSKQMMVTGDKILEEGGICVFIGPAGAGKTTSIAKIALQFTQTHSKKDIVMISTDASRIGAHEQLAAYGRLLSVPVIRATDESQIREIILAMQDKALVLVDTAGLAQRDLRNPHNIQTLQLDIPNLHHYLVLPATAQYQTLERIISAFAKHNITGGILTKLDEAANLGEILSATIANQFPVSYWTENQKITSNLNVATQRQLVEKAVSVLRSRSGLSSSNDIPQPSASQQPLRQQP